MVLKARMLSNELRNHSINHNNTFQEIEFVYQRNKYGNKLLLHNMSDSLQSLGLLTYQSSEITGRILGVLLFALLRDLPDTGTES